MWVRDLWISWMTFRFDYSEESAIPKNHTEQVDRFYSRFAWRYDWLVKSLPFWRNWIMSALPWIHGPNVLEVSFGTGFLLTQYADRFTAYGVDHNWRFSKLTNCWCYKHTTRWWLTCEHELCILKSSRLITSNIKGGSQANKRPGQQICDSANRWLLISGLFF